MTKANLSINELLNSNRDFSVMKMPQNNYYSLSYQNNFKVCSYTDIAQIKQEGTLFHPFSVTIKTPILFIKNENTYRFPVAPTTLNNTNPINFSEQEDAPFYRDLVQKAIEEINLGTFEKVVVSRKKEIFQKLNIELFYNALCATYPEASVYLFHSEISGTWMGASPELLLTSKNNYFETIALAGTKFPSEGWTKKEYAEQEVVVKYIQQLLQDNECTDIKLSERITVNAGKIQHLKTIISAITDKSAAKIASILHPTPAVCGMPKDKALDFILANEKYSREYYCGFFGHIGKESRLMVNLRCVNILPNKQILYAGGGIVSKSNPDKEYIETERKMQTLLSVIEKL